MLYICDRSTHSWKKSNFWKKIFIYLFFEKKKFIKFKKLYEMTIVWFNVFIWHTAYHFADNMSFW